MSDFEVSFYTCHDGGKPAKDFILGLDKKMRTKMLRTIEILEDKSNLLREPYPAEIERAKKNRKDYLERMTDK